MNVHPLSIGMSFRGMDQGSFLGQTHFDEYNQIFWQIASVKGELERKSAPEWISLRFVQLDQWVRCGNTLIVVGVMPIWAQDDEICLNSYEPLAGVSFQVAEGIRMEACGSQAGRKLLAILAEHMAYSFLLSGNELSPLLRVLTARKDSPIQMVGAIRSLGAGHVIYLPRLKGAPADWEIPFAAIRELPAVLVRREPDELPNWAHDFRSGSERGALVAIEALKAEATRIEEEMARHRLVLADAARLKQLLAGSGEAFANAAATALRELGFSVTEGQHPRADLVISDGRQIAAIEVKGVEGPIAEKHLRQLWAWMTEIDNILSTSPEERSREQADYAAAIAGLNTPVGDFLTKGLLIVGTFRTTPLDERVVPDVPDPVQRRLTLHDVCVLSGLQLLGLVLAGRRDPSLKPLMVRELMDTRGRLKRALDWKEFLSSE